MVEGSTTSVDGFSTEPERRPLVDEKAAAYAAFVKKMAPPFLTLHDVAQKLVRTVAVPAMPTTYLIGRDGKVRFIHAGYQGESTDKILRTQIDKLLAAN